MTDRASLLAASDLVPGKPGASAVYTRMTLPLDDDDHMPPRDKAQPSAAEIEAVRSWIQQGARGDDRTASDAGP